MGLFGAYHSWIQSDGSFLRLSRVVHSIRRPGPVIVEAEAPTQDCPVVQSRIKTHADSEHQRAVIARHELRQVPEPFGEPDACSPEAS